MNLIIKQLTFICFTLISFLILISCSIFNKKNESRYNAKIVNWQHKDLSEDNIHGTSFEKWTNLNKKKKENKEIVVAVIDTQIDLNHENLQKQFWINQKEIPNNKIDDDGNGYIDDTNGWNFIGVSDNDIIKDLSYEYVRYFREWDSIFKNKDEKTINNEGYEFKEYKRADNFIKDQLNFYTYWKKSIIYNIELYDKAKDTLKHFFPNENYGVHQLDSLYNKYKINDKTFKERRDDNDQDLGALIYLMKLNYEMNQRTLQDLIKVKNYIDSIINKKLNINYFDRFTLNLKKGCGNSLVNTKEYSHATEVTSTITSNNLKNNLGFSDYIKIMNLVVASSGDEHDNDIAMAIYYAVDNGAKVLNMSFGKEFSLKQEWVTEAFKYAEKNNVLIVHGSGNNRFDVDIKPYYPSDYDYNKKINVVSNFINVGSISKRTDSTMVSAFSNYGKKNVDLFAPGEDIYVATPGNQYTYDSGTSLAAPMVSGTAALIWLYYPNLTVQEVKKIILESGVSIDKKVVKPGTKNEMVPFSELCKSGKILNTYNAMKMAEEISKKK